MQIAPELPLEIPPEFPKGNTPVLPIRIPREITTSIPPGIQHSSFLRETIQEFL